eukprot:5304377-Heterocapsa_arctica.AAC.1
MIDELCKEIEEGKLGLKAELKERVKDMRKRCDWPEGSAHKIWCYGPETDGVNIVVDAITAA